jgi:hypothetical protein
MNKTIWMSMAAIGISVAFVSAGMGQQSPAGPQGPGAVQTPAAIHGVPSAKTAPARETWEKIRGVVEKVNPSPKEITIQTDRGTMMTFAVGGHSYITELTTDIPLSALKKGTGVTIEYAKEGNQLMAKWVDVHRGRAEAKPMILAQAKEGKKENPPATSASAPAKEVKKEGTSAPQGQAKEVKKETPPVAQPPAKEGKTTEKK